MYACTCIVKDENRDGQIFSRKNPSCPVGQSDLYINVDFNFISLNVTKKYFQNHNKEKIFFNLIILNQSNSIENFA